MKVKHIFVDIDGTLVVYHSDREFSRSPEGFLTELVMEKHGISEKEAREKIRRCGDPELHCLSEFLEELEVDRARFFDGVKKSVEENLDVPEDTVRLLDFIREKGFELYTATTNSPFATWAKLAKGGLASVNGSEYFTDYFPGCAFQDPRGKNDPDYYAKILGTGRFDPEYCMMIGDIPEKDALPAMKAGMKYGVIIDRSRKEPLTEKEGVLYINSFHALIPMLEK